jgi:putative hydroxymethylpyrimidine transport system substrate-binding protein
VSPLVPRPPGAGSLQRLVAALATLAALLALAACGAKSDDVGPPPGGTRLDVVLDYFPNADHAGLYAAIQSGQFRAVGLDVRPRTPPDPSAPLKLLLAGKADLAISYEPEVLLARDRGARIVSVGALVQAPLTSIMALGSAGIRTPADLRGKTVGTAGIPYQTAYLDTILRRAGVPPASVKRVDVGFNLVPAMLSRRVDATLGAFWNYEGVQLAREGKRPSIIRMEKVGVPAYNELVVVARRDDLGTEKARILRRFLAALGRGYAIARDDQARAADALVKANPDLDRSLQVASVTALHPVLFPARRGKPFGWQDRAAWDAYGRWMLANRLLRMPPDASRALTNEFLPGEGL